MREIMVKASLQL